MRRIAIFDTTLRDGEQSPGAAMTGADRLRIAQLLSESGADVIEAGFPAASPAVYASVRDIASRVRSSCIAALARCTPGDVDLAAEALEYAEHPRIHVFIATSEVHLEHKLRMTQEQALEVAASTIRRARRYCAEVEFSAEDATRSDRKFLARIFAAAIEAGAGTVNVPDTVGYATPPEMADLIRYLRENVDGIDHASISAHTHDDLGMATANALAAIEAGASQIECTVNGIGERAGNCALEEVVVALRTRGDRFDADTRFDTSGIARLSRAVSRATRMPVQKNKAIVGRNAFAHESGIHQDGVLKERSTYEIVDPRSVGRANTLPLGRNSGRHAVFARAEALGLQLDGDELARFYAAFTAFAQGRRRVLDGDLLRLAKISKTDVAPQDDPSTAFALAASR